MHVIELCLPRGFAQFQPLYFSVDIAGRSTIEHYAQRLYSISLDIWPNTPELLTAK